MNRLFVHACLLFAGVVAGCSPDFVEERPWTLEELEVEVANRSREVGFTNKKAGFLYTESNGFHRNSWQGWHVGSVKILNDYRIDVDGRFLDRGTVSYSRVWPHQFTRAYHEGVQETVAFLDSIDGFVVLLEQVRAQSAALSLLFDQSISPTDRESTLRDGVLIFSPFTESARRLRPDVPGWIAVCGLGGDASAVDTVLARGDELLNGSVRMRVDGARAGFIVVAAGSPEEALTLASGVREALPSHLSARRERMERLLNESFVRTSNRRFDRALAWARLSLDALVMNQGRKGIFAGLPWFSNYWGRDTFISLPGATLVTGRFADASEILWSFARWQNTDAASPNEGRVPNIVTPTSLAYNTADGTPWFALGVSDYVRTSGDTAFAREIYPVLRRAIEGPLKHRADKSRYLTHEDAETWMDAAGPAGPWSPRGNRANDIQALWYRQLLTSAAIAEMLGERRDAERWVETAKAVFVAFQQDFVDDERGVIVDHLNPDGTADESVRPNQLFALKMIGDDVVRQRVFRTVTEHLVYPHGVGSLSFRDEHFHPYHHYAPMYVQDAAYHNGIVWTWLNGPWVQAAVDFGKPDLAWQVTDNMVHQILERGAVGTMSELLDAVPRRSDQAPLLSGTFSQAWSLAEFIRTTHQSTFGVSVNAPDRQVWLYPRLPASLTSATFDIHVGKERIRASLSGDGERGSIRLNGEHLKSPVSVSIGWPFSNKRGRACNIRLKPSQTLDIELTEDSYTVEADDDSEISIDSQVQFLTEYPLLHELALARPTVPENLRSLRGPEYPLLEHSTVKREMSGGTVLVDRADPEGDDRGTGRFTYPQTTHLRPGSLDLTGFRVTASDSLLHFELTFRALSDPGWHREYGFQLTFAAIAIDTDGRRGSGRSAVGSNALYTLPPGLEYEAIIFVGGGLRVEDANGKTLAVYHPMPEDVKNPLGDASRGTISFAIPVSLVGEPSPSWRYTVLIGAQDDHGGAGIGEFRRVEKTASEWVGGGKRTPAEPNVYDFLEVKERPGGPPAK